MDLNLKEALNTLYPGLFLVLIRAGILAAGGFSIIIVFGMLLFTFRAAGGVSTVVAVVIAIAAFLGLAVSGLVLQRFFLFRYRAAMLLLFSGRKLPAPGLRAAIHESGSLFGNYSQWQALNLKLRRALLFPSRWNGQILKKMPSGGMRRLLDWLADGVIGQAVLVLAFSRGGADITLSVREGLALFPGHGAESRRLARNWLRFSAAGLALLFFCLALPNWFIFSSAGVPIWIGMALAAIISGLLHQAFVVPFILAGVSGALLAETNGKTPEPALCEKLAPFFTP